MIYLCNVDENGLNDLSQDNYFSIIKNYALNKNISCLWLCGNLEMDIS